MASLKRNVNKGVDDERFTFAIFDENVLFAWMRERNSFRFAFFAITTRMPLGAILVLSTRLPLASCSKKTTVNLNGGTEPVEQADPMSVSEE